MKHTCVHITTYGYCILYIGYARFMRDYSYLGPEGEAQGIQTAVINILKPFHSGHPAQFIVYNFHFTNSN